MLTIQVCSARCCHVNGSNNVVQAFKQLIEENLLHDEIEVKSAYCEHREQNGDVMVSVGDNIYYIKPEAARAFFKAEIMPLADTEKYMLINFRVHSSAVQ